LNELEGETPDRIDVKPVKFGIRDGYYVLYPLALKKHLLTTDTSEYDVAVAHTPLPYSIHNTPLITKYHDCTPETRKYMRSGLSLYKKIGDSILHPFRKSIDRRSLRNSDYAIFNSGVNKNGWTRNYEFEGAYSIVHNGVDTDLFYPEEESDEEYVVFVGTTEQKGLSAVLEYADKDQRPVHIVGSFNSNHQNIITHGRVSQEKLRDIYSSAAATIHPAHFESFGNSVLESLACGTPVVTTCKTGSSEILTEETGVVTDNLEVGIEKAVTFDSAACREVAVEYEWSDVGDETLQIFRQVSSPST
jgi:glycosyltransferase involved in cell wall biosynthesis